MKNHKIPSIRFKGFNDAWEQRKLGEITYQSGEKNVDDHPYESYSVSNTEGFINQKEQFKYGGLVSVADKSKSIIVTPHTFAYNPARIDIGSIGYQNLDKNVIISPMYEIFKAKNEFLDDRFLWHWLKSDIFNRIVVNNQEGGVRTCFNLLKFFEACITIPKSVKEQRLIGELFDIIDQSITLHQRKCDVLTHIKKSLLENMFPCNHEKTPKIRFKGFSDAWEQRKLGELMDVGSVKRIHQEDWVNEGIRFLRARDIVAIDNHEIIPDEDKLYITKKKYDEYSSISGKVNIGDLLVTGVGTIGVPLLISTLKPVYFKDGNIIWFKNANRIDGQFLLMSFKAKTIQKHIKDATGIGTVGTYTIDSGKKTPIYLPSQSEQIKIGRLFKNLDDLITLHQRKCEKLKNMKKSLLEGMFI